MNEYIHSAEYRDAQNCDQLMPSPLEKFALKRDAVGYFTRDGFLGSRVAKCAAEEMKGMELKTAGMGYKEFRYERANKRGDAMTWLDKSMLLRDTFGAAELVRRVDTLIKGFAQQDDFNLTGKCSIQYAVYPSGARYVKHIDAHKDNSESSRKVTCIYYLNENWKMHHGGHLRLHLQSDIWDVAPMLDSLVVFRSSDVPHQVLPTNATRAAITFWYYGSDKFYNTIPKVAKCDIDTCIPMNHVPIQHLKPLPVEKGDAGATIFVSIVSYRDSELYQTMENIVQSAQFGNRVHFGVCIQENMEEMSERIQKRFSAQARILNIDWRNAKGPSYARYLVTQLYHDEAYFLQIDSHMRFRKNWDTFLIDQLYACPTEKAVISTYPQGYVRPNFVPSATWPTILQLTHFDEDGILRQKSTIVPEIFSKPKQHSLVAAGFLFTSANILHSIPALYSPMWNYLFFGEEMVYALLLWTHGWDSFAPTEAVAYHLWSRAYRPNYKSTMNGTSQYSKKLALERVLRMQKGEHRGTVRGLHTFEYALHVDLRTKSVYTSSP